MEQRRCEGVEVDEKQDHYGAQSEGGGVYIPRPWLPGSVTLSHSWDEASDGGPVRSGLVSCSCSSSAWAPARTLVSSEEEGSLTSKLVSSMISW